MTNLSFTRSNTALQGNVIGYSFTKIADDTVIGGYVNKYRYYYEYTPIYCGNKGGGYAYYDESNWKKSPYYELDYSNEPVSDSATLDFTIPPFQWDAAIRLQVEVYDDSTGMYFSSGRGLSPIFVAFYNRNVQITLSQVQRSNGRINMSVSIDESGYIRPSNYLQSELLASQSFADYIQNFRKCFDPHVPVLRWEGSVKKDFNTALSEEISAYNWETNFYTRSFSLSFDSPGELSEQNNAYYRVSISYADEGKDYKFATDKTDGTIYSNVILVPAAISSFQVKRRSVKSQMLENDVIGTFSVGAGMFNHSDLVGALVPPMKENYLYEYLSPEYVITCPRDTTGTTKNLMQFEKVDTQGTVDFIPFWPTATITFNRADIEALHFAIVLEQDLGNGNTQNYTFSGHFKYDTDNRYTFVEENEDDRIKATLVKWDGTHSPVYVEVSLNGNSELLLFKRVALFAYPRAALDVTKGHSIALYDTHAKGDSPANQPSIGFMNEEHRELASLKYESGYLVSNVPIKHPGNDPEISGNSQTIVLKLVDGSTKTIEGYFTVT